MTEISSEKEASSANIANSPEMNSASSEPKENEQEKSFQCTASNDIANDISAAIDNTIEDIDTKLDTTTTTTKSTENGSADHGTDTVSSTTNDSKEDKEATKTEGPSEPKPKVDNNLYYPKSKMIFLNFPFKIELFVFSVLVTKMKL